MHLREVIKGLKDGTIIIKDGGHSCDSLLNRLESDLERIEKHIAEYKEMIKNGIEKDGNVTPQGMIDFYNINLEVKIGHYIHSVERQCSNCDSTMYVILVDENTICYIPSGKYWETANLSGKKYEYRAVEADCPQCEAAELVKSKKLTSHIDVPSGQLIFQNYFEKDELYDKKERYSRPSICSILGRNELMQELAEKNVGYGQMGNMSVTIYSNGKDEVLVGSSIESYLDNKAYYEKNPDKIDKQWKKEVKDAENFIRTIEEGKFKRLGEISLSVWRWMCMDKKLMEEHGEKVAGEYSKKYYSEHVPVKLKSGKYRIDHFFDFPKNGDYLYSRIKLIN
ncbi:MAG: hypothetical protein KDH96_10950 [Candidatus Riesia sp.]|nr:hypothetical protein [Candidatus Riesia sp.]